MKTKNIILIAVLVGGLIYFRDLKQIAKKTMTGSYFSIDELSSSDVAQKYGIDNTPTPSAKANLQALITNVLDPARESLGSAVYVYSGYRNQQVNSLVGGVSNSQHTTGEAADITAGSLAKNRKLFSILAHMGNYDQLIWEGNGTWIHVSYKTNGINRQDMLAQTNTGYMNIKNNWKQIV